MIVSFGKHQGRSVEELVLREADYLVFGMWRESDSEWDILQVCKRASQLIAAFDGKPFVKPCSNPDCRRRVTRFTVYGPNIQPFFWCDHCNPYSMGASRGKIQELRTYADAVLHVQLWCPGRRTMKPFIRSLATAKGLPTRAGAKQAIAFFGT